MKVAIFREGQHLADRGYNGPLLEEGRNHLIESANWLAESIGRNNKIAYLSSPAERAIDSAYIIRTELYKRGNITSSFESVKELWATGDSNMSRAAEVIVKKLSDIECDFAVIVTNKELAPFLPMSFKANNWTGWDMIKTYFESGQVIVISEDGSWDFYIPEQ